MFGEKKYKVKDLYVAHLGLVRLEKRYSVSHSSYKVSTVKENRVIVQKKDSKAISPTTKVAYGYFHKCSSLDEHIGELMIYKESPLALICDQEKLSILEIKELEDRLNGRTEGKTQDNKFIILERVWDIAQKAKAIEDEDIKTDIAHQLYIMADSFIEDSTNKIMGLETDEQPIDMETRLSQLDYLEADIDMILGNSRKRK